MATHQWGPPYSLMSHTLFLPLILCSSFHVYICIFFPLLNPPHLITVISLLPSPNEPPFFNYFVLIFSMILFQSSRLCCLSLAKILPLVISPLTLHTRTVPSRPASSPSTHAHPSPPALMSYFWPSHPPPLPLFLSISILPTDHHVSTKMNGYKAPFKDTCVPYQDLLVPNSPGQFLAGTNNGRGCSAGYGGTLEMRSKCYVCVGEGGSSGVSVQGVRDEKPGNS